MAAALVKEKVAEILVLRRTTFNCSVHISQLCVPVNKYSVISHATLQIAQIPTSIDDSHGLTSPLSMLVSHLSTTVLSWSFSWKWYLTLQMLFASAAFPYRKAERICLETIVCHLLSLSFLILKGTVESGGCAILITCQCSCWRHSKVCNIFRPPVWGQLLSKKKNPNQI